jgi:hypothetical protein
MNTPIKDHIKSRKFKSFDQLDAELDEWVDTMIKKSRCASGIYITGERKPLWNIQHERIKYGR